MAATGVILVSGCGLDVDFMGGETVTPGQPATFQLKVTNISACPLLGPPAGAPNFVFLPLIDAAVVQENEVLSQLCGLDTLPAASAGLAADGSLPDEVVQALLGSASGVAMPAVCSGTGVICQSVEPEPGLSSGGAICDIGAFGPGDMRTLTCTATTPLGSGTRYTIAGSIMLASGVCKAGPGQGQACSGDGDCGMGGVCGDGICVAGGNDDNGCTVAAAPSECPGGSCTRCATDEALGVACSASALVGGPAPAPAVSPSGLVLSGVVLSGIALMALRRRARR